MLSLMLPICSNAGIEVDKIAVNVLVIEFSKSRLWGKGTNGAGAIESFTEMNIDWWACLWLETT